MGENLCKSYIWQGANTQNTWKTHNSIAKTIKNGLKLWIEFFSEEDIQMANRYMKRCPTSLIIKEAQIKTAIRYSLIPVRIVINRKIRSECFQGYGKKEHLCIVGGKVNWYNHYVKQYGDSSEN